MSRGRKGNKIAKSSSQVGDSGNYTVMRRRVWHAIGSVSEMRVAAVDGM